MLTKTEPMSTEFYNTMKKSEPKEHLMKGSKKKKKKDHKKTIR